MKMIKSLKTNIQQFLFLVLAVFLTYQRSAVADYELPAPEQKCGCPEGEWNHNTCKSVAGHSEVCGGKCYNVFFIDILEELGPSRLRQKSNNASFNNATPQEPIVDCEIAVAPLCGCKGDQVCALRYGFGDSCSKALCYKRPNNLPDGKDPWEHAKDLCNKGTYSGSPEAQYNSWLACVRSYVMSGGYVEGPVYCG